MSGKLRCAGCNQEFLQGDEVQPVPQILRYLRGMKSGAMGLYQHENFPEAEPDYVHWRHSCLEKFFSPIENPYMYDGLVAKLRGDLKLELRDEHEEQFALVKEMIGEGNHNFCVECWTELEDADIPLLEREEPPKCLWCKHTDQVWMQQKPGGLIFYCFRCSKMWDDYENEMEVASGAGEPQQAWQRD